MATGAISAVAARRKSKVGSMAQMVSPARSEGTGEPIRYVGPSFASWVSLGFNCEVAFQFRRALGADSSSFFSWNITEIEPLLAVLAGDFSNILLDHNVEAHPGDGLIIDHAYGYRWHGFFTTPRPQDDPAFAERMEEQRAKASHLVKKFRTAVGGRRCYFYKPRETILPEQAAKLVEALKAYGDNHELVIVRSREFADRPLGVSGLYERFLDRVAPDHDATDGHVQSWDRIFQEFPHVQPMRLAGF